MGRNIQFIIYSAILVWMTCFMPRIVMASPLAETSPFRIPNSSFDAGITDTRGFRDSFSCSDILLHDSNNFIFPSSGWSYSPVRSVNRNVFFGSDSVVDQDTTAARKPSFFREHNVAYLLVPLAHAGLSVYLYELRYKNHHEKNAMGTFNAYLSVCAASALAGGILGYLIWPPGDGFLGNLQKLIGGLIGVVAGGITGIIVTNKFDLPHRFKTNRPLYYSAPLITMTVGTIMF